jgi:excisionase family DNA binding protein
LGFVLDVTVTHLATWVNNGLRRETKREIIRAVKCSCFTKIWRIAKMEVKRICQWCGKPFIAQKTTTNYCSPQCSKRGYKHRMKERRMELIQSQELLEVKKMLENQEYFTFSQAAKLMGVSRQYIYKLVKEDKLRASRISSRMSFIRRADIELLLKSKPYERVMSKVEFDIAEYYTAEEIAQKYKVNTKWVWTYTREHNVPKVKIRQFNYYSKKHIDAAFAKYKTDNDLTEWYTPEEIEQKYGMSRVAIRSHVYRNNIPSKKEHGQIFYSKLHFDLSKQTAEDNASEYYTVQEAMKKYNLTRDSVYGILQFHEIKREKKGRFVRFLKVEFDHVMGVRK